MATCKGCGKRIEWAETIDGKTVPLDPAPPVYEVYKQAKDGSLTVRLVPLSDGPRKIRTHMVSHFATCPKASDFSGGGR